MQTSAIPAQPEIVAVPLTTTNAIAPPPESSKTGHEGALAVGAAFLAAAGGLVVSCSAAPARPAATPPATVR